MNSIMNYSPVRVLAVDYRWPTPALNSSTVSWSYFCRPTIYSLYLESNPALGLEMSLGRIKTRITLNRDLNYCDMNLLSLQCVFYLPLLYTQITIRSHNVHHRRYIQYNTSYIWWVRLIYRVFSNSWHKLWQFV